MKMVRIIIVLLIAIAFTGFPALMSQCSICTKTAMQQGVKPAQGLNTGIVYLMLAPFAVVGYVGYRWWKNENEVNEQV